MSLIEYIEEQVDKNGQFLEFLTEKTDFSVNWSKSVFVNGIVEEFETIFEHIKHPQSIKLRQGIPSTIEGVAETLLGVKRRIVKKNKDMRDRAIKKTQGRANQLQNDVTWTQQRADKLQGEKVDLTEQVARKTQKLTSVRADLAGLEQKLLNEKWLLEKLQQFKERKN
jgi:chromosome segregation ATPase